MSNYVMIGIAVVAVLFILLLLAYNLLNKKIDVTWKVHTKDQLLEIASRLNSNNPIVLKSIIIDSDKLLDFVLKHKGFKGDTMGERLKSAQKSFDWQSYNSIWEAHKLRNTLVHEMNANISLNQARNHFYSLEKGIKKLL